jgi:hypothetical protein
LNDAVSGTFEEEIRPYKGPPVTALIEHWNYTDEGKDFLGVTSSAPGALPRQGATSLAVSGGWSRVRK